MITERLQERAPKLQYRPTRIGMCVMNRFGVSLISLLEQGHYQSVNHHHTARIFVGLSLLCASVVTSVQALYLSTCINTIDLTMQVINVNQLRKL